MLFKKIIKPFMFIIIFPLLLLFLWNFMIYTFAGWSGLTWVSYSLWFGIVILLLFNAALITFLCKWETLQKKWLKVFIFFIVNTLVFIAAFDCGRLLASVYYSGVGVSGPVSDALLPFGGLIPVFLIAVLSPSIGSVLLIRVCLIKISLWTIAFILLGFCMAWLCSLGLWALLNTDNFFSAYGVPEMVKQGIPLYWGVGFYLLSLQGGLLIQNKKIKKT